MDMGKEIVIVSSGARIAGVGTLVNGLGRKTSIINRHCRIGQVELMDSYRKSSAVMDFRGNSC